MLRRQVPVRWEEPARSWIGGLPRMPESVEWPVGPTTDYPERGLTPLHFVAQIACADLPPELCGAGSVRARVGSCCFSTPELGCDGERRGDPRPAHSELGPERAPPPGIHPVHDEIYTGPDYGFVRAQEDIPTVWRRWPVDLVTIPNRVIGARIREASASSPATIARMQGREGGVVFTLDHSGSSDEFARA